VLAVVDFQPTQVSSVASMDRRALVQNAMAVVSGATEFKIPIVVTTVNVAKGESGTVSQLRSLLPVDTREIDRTTINAWEQPEFRAAIEATGRTKVVIIALWTEACLTFPTLDMLRARYEVYPVFDAVGGTSLVAHDLALTRMTQAGAKPVGWVQLLCEWQRDWARAATVPAFRALVFSSIGK
jgi:nicotinamidase-related amidase